MLVYPSDWQGCPKCECVPLLCPGNADLEALLAWQAKTLATSTATPRIPAESAGNHMASATIRSSSPLLVCRGQRSFRNRWRGRARAVQGCRAWGEGRAGWQATQVQAQAINNRRACLEGIGRLLHQVEAFSRPKFQAGASRHLNTQDRFVRPLTRQEMPQQVAEAHPR